MLEIIALAVLGYLLGSVSSAIVVCRLLGLPDPRGQGSGNPGTTNVLRLGGKTAAALTLAGDVLKGTLPVVIARLVSDAPAAAALAGLTAFLGHLYPVFFGFRGGKGVATGLGVLLGWSWPAALATMATWLAVACASRISSLSALVSFLLAPLYVWWLTASPAPTIATAAMAVAIYWRHRSNIANLIAGTEGKISLGEKREG